VSREMEGSWSREQIASGLRLVGSGVPVIEEHCSQDGWQQANGLYVRLCWQRRS